VIIRSVRPRCDDSGKARAIIPEHELSGRVIGAAGSGQLFVSRYRNLARVGQERGDRRSSSWHADRDDPKKALAGPSPATRIHRCFDFSGRQLAQLEDVLPSRFSEVLPNSS